MLGLFADGLQSGFHFALNVLLLRTLSGYEYGLFAIVLTAGGVALAYGGALAGVPASVLIPRLRSPAAARFEDVVLGSAASLFGACGGLATATGLALSGAGWTVAAGGGLFVAAWSMRGYVRAAAFAGRRPGEAARSDLAFAGAGAVLLLAAAGLDRLSLAVSFGVLAAAHAFGAGLGLIGRGRTARISLGPGVRRRYRRHWSQIRWSLAGVTTATLQAQCLTVLIAVTHGPAAYGPIAAALVLVGPLRLVGTALISMVQPELAAALARGRPAEAARLLAVCSGAVLCACLAYGAVLWAGWPVIRNALFAAAFADQPMGQLAVLAWAVVLAYLSYAVPQALLEAAGQFRRVAAASLAASAFGIGGIAILLATAPPGWSLAGLLAAEIVASVLLGSGALRILRMRAAPTPRPRPRRRMTDHASGTRPAERRR